MKASNKKQVLINGFGQSRFYFGIDAITDQPIVGIEHPDSEVVIFIAAPVLASMNGWIARLKANNKLNPTIIN